MKPFAVLAALAALAALIAAGAGCSSDMRTTCEAGSCGGDQVVCSGASSMFPSFDKTCAGVADCAFDIHQTNCCGATLAIGFNKAEAARFAADEKTCVAQYPLCGCPATPTMTEDGLSVTAGQAIAVACQSGRCMTTVK
jgi:hypothetical protein